MKEVENDIDTASARRLKVVIADRNIEGAQKVAEELRQNGQDVSAVHVEMADWETQVQGIESAVKGLGRIDYVFIVAGIFEQSWLPNRPKATEFEVPNLATLEVNGTGALYATSLAIQQFHRQEPNKHGFRGKSMAHILYKTDIRLLHRLIWFVRSCDCVFWSWFLPYSCHADIHCLQTVSFLCLD